MAEYKGKEVKLDDPFRLPQGSDKKFGVYVKNPKSGNVIMVKFGDPNLSIKRDDPERLKTSEPDTTAPQKQIKPLRVTGRVSFGKRINQSQNYSKKARSVKNGHRNTRTLLTVTTQRVLVRKHTAKH